MSSAQSRDELRKLLGAPVPDELLELACTHPGAANAGERVEKSNQRLEFLGDAVVGAAVAAHLYHAMPLAPEGVLTHHKIAAVRREALAAAALRLDLGRYLLLGAGEERTGGRSRASNLADLFEALAGAVFLSAGWESAQKFVCQSLEPELRADSVPLSPAKNRLQELTQGAGQGTPRYQTFATNKAALPFAATVLLNDEVRGCGEGASKKAAEEAAAAAALKAMAAEIETTGIETTGIVSAA